MGSTARRNNPKVIGLSPGELILLKMIPKDGKKITIAELSDKFYLSPVKPFHHRTIVNGMVNSIIRKMTYNRETRRLRRSPRRGPHSTSVWFE